MIFIEIILPVFLIIFTGFVLEKKSRLDFRTLTVASLYIFAPALVFSALMARPLNFSLAGGIFLFMLLYTAVLYAISWSCGRMLLREMESRSALLLTTVVMNSGNFGLPLVLFAFGDSALEAGVLTFVIFNIPLSTLAVILAQKGRAPLAQALGNMLKIPIFHAVALAFALKVLGTSAPEFLLRPLHLVGQAAIPVMLLMLGMQLARTRLQANFGFLGLAAGIRLALAPLLAWALTWMLGMGEVESRVLILQTSTPAAVLPLLYALRFGTRPDLVAGAIFVTTLLSAVSLTVVLALL